MREYTISKYGQPIRRPVGRQVDKITCSNCGSISDRRTRLQVFCGLQCKVDMDRETRVANRRKTKQQLLSRGHIGWNSDKTAVLHGWEI